MLVTGIFTMPDGTKVVSGETAWEDNVKHRVNDTLMCGSKHWKVTAVDRIYQGCFSAPKLRWHCLKLEPIDHDELPNVNDILIGKE